LDDEVEFIPQEPLSFPLEDIPPSNQLNLEPQISLPALIGISTPQALKLIGYIKHHKIIILFGSGGTHKFIQ
jgi:hypothetical protein